MANKPQTELNLRQTKFVAAYLADPHNNGRAAAIKAGYSSKNAACHAGDLLRSPLVKAAIDKARAEIVERGKFSAAEAMRRLDAAADFARETKNATALARVLELSMRLHGMLIDKAQIQVETVDLGATLIEARKRTATSYAVVEPCEDPDDRGGGAA